MNDQADLSHLADIVMPLPIGWWPLAPGWWILGAAFIAAAAILIGQAVLRYRANAYRRAALAELARVDGSADIAGISAVLKRAALAAYPRATVAGLTGTGWLAFLDRTGGTDAFTRSSAGFDRMEAGVHADKAAIVAAARRWLKRHRAEL
jgi:hypothetical protein